MADSCEKCAVAALWCLVGFCPFWIAIVVLVPLSLQNTNPRGYIQDFYVPPLNTFVYSNATGSDNLIFFDLRLENMMVMHKIRYQDINITISYGRDFPVANYTVPGFRQGKAADNNFRELLNFRDISWMGDAFRAVSNGSTAEFRFELVTIIKKKKKGEELTLGADVQVDHSGVKLHHKDIRLRSGAQRTISHALLGAWFFISLLAHSMW